MRRWRARSICDRASLVGRSGDEALPLLLTLSSGVKGFTTIHAGSARQALSRLRFMCQLSDAATQLPLAALNALVSESIDLVVHCARSAEGPYVTEIIAVEDLAGAPDASPFTVTPLFGPGGEGGQGGEGADRGSLAWSGNLPVRVGRILAGAGLDVRDLLEPDRQPGAVR